MKAFNSKRSNAAVQQQGENTGGAEAAVAQMIDQTNKEFDIAEVFPYLKQISKQRKFNESLELILKLNVDPT